MAGEIQDVQTSTFTVQNDNTEQQVYAFAVPANTVTGATLYRLALGGTVSARLVAPGTLTLRLKYGSSTVVIFSETMLTGVSSAAYLGELDIVLFPTGDVVLSGIFVQNAADVLSVSGPRISRGTGTENMTQDNLIRATAQFSAADTNNAFTRQLAILQKF